MAKTSKLLDVAHIYDGQVAWFKGYTDRVSGDYKLYREYYTRSNEGWMKKHRVLVGKFSYYPHMVDYINKAIQGYDC